MKYKLSSLLVVFGLMFLFSFRTDKREAPNLVRHEFNMEYADTLSNTDTAYLTFPHNLELPYNYIWTINVDTISGSHSGSKFVLQRSDFVKADIWSNTDTVNITGPGNFSVSGSAFSGFRHRVMITTGGTHSSLYRGGANYKALYPN